MERLEQQFMEQGYRRIQTSVPQVQGFLREEGECPVCVCVIDNQEEFLDAYGKQEYLTERMGQMLGQKLQREVRCIGIVLTGHPAQDRHLASGQSPCWYLDIPNRRRIVYEDQPGSFYGVEQLIDAVLEAEEDSGLREGQKAAAARKRVRAFDLTPVNTTIVILNVLVFLIYEWIGSTEDAAFLYQYGGMSIETVLGGGQYWRLLSSAFLHFGLSHLFNNMVVLAFTGDNLERAIGSVKYLLFYLLGAVGSGLVSCLWMFLMGQHYVVSVGASGAIFAVLGGMFYILIRDHGQREDLSIWKVGLFLCFSIFQGFTSVTTNNSAHISGLVIGFLLAMILYRNRKSAAE